MSRLATAEFSAITIATASGDYELFELDPADDEAIEIVAFWIYVTSELAEAQEEWANLRIIRGHATDGTGGASATPRLNNPADGAVSWTADTCRTVIASTGSPVNLASFAMNVRNGWEFPPVPEGYGWFCREADGLIVVRLTAAVTDDVTMSGTILVRAYP